MTPFSLFLHFVAERERVRINKEAGLPAPWTEDKILQFWRFCNIRREDDRVTRWIAGNWREPYAQDPDVWFAMAVARHVNLPETLEEVGYPVPWKPKRFTEAIRGRKNQKLTAYNAAYMIRASSAEVWEDKAHYLAVAVLGQLWKRRKELRPKIGDTLEGFHERLEASFGLGSFMGAQIAADTKYVSPLKESADWWNFVASGPGSRRGLNRLLGRDPKSRWKEQDWRGEFIKFRAQLREPFQIAGLSWLHAQDLQNCMCEFSKYARAYVGEGTPKQRYRPRGLLG